MDASTTFSEWYAVVDPGFTGAKVTRRHSAAATLASKLSLENATSLVLVFYSQNPGGGFVEMMRNVIREEDDTYISHDQAELAIVAAGTLDTLFRKSSVLARACALLILCGEFGAFNEVSRVDAVVRSAEQYVQAEGSRMREQSVTYPNLADLLRPASKKLQAATKERTANETEPEVDDCLAIDGDLIGALKSFGNTLNQCLVTLEKRHLEESGVLYWLLGARVLVTEDAFRGIEKPRLALLAAHDLAKHTQQIPGPASSGAILRSVLAYGLEPTRDVSVESCVGSVAPEEGLRLLSNSIASHPVFMPITLR